MKVTGTVLNATGRTPVEAARVVLSIDSVELAVLYTNSDGQITYNSTGSYGGRSLGCKAEKEGFHERAVTFAVEDDVEFRIEIVPKDPTALKEVRRDDQASLLEMRLRLQDREGRPVTGMTVTCEKDGFKTFTGVSDERGMVHVLLKPAPQP